MSSNSPSCHSNFYKRRLIYSGSGDAFVNDISVIDFPPPANAVSTDASTFACPVTVGRVIASVAAGRGSAADTYTYAALKASSVTARCTIINPFTADVATASANGIHLHLRSISICCWATIFNLFASPPWSQWFIIGDMWCDAAAGGTHYTMAGGICSNNSVTRGGEDDIPKRRWGDIVPEMQWQYCWAKRCYLTVASFLPLPKLVALSLYWNQPKWLHSIIKLQNNFQWWHLVLMWQSVHHLVAHMGLCIGAQTLPEKGQL